jgi:hypothetical protein
MASKKEDKDKVTIMKWWAKPALPLAVAYNLVWFTTHIGWITLLPGAISYILIMYFGFKTIERKEIGKDRRFMLFDVHSAPPITESYQHEQSMEIVNYLQERDLFGGMEDQLKELKYLAQDVFEKAREKPEIRRLILIGYLVLDCMAEAFKGLLMAHDGESIEVHIPLDMTDFASYPTTYAKERLEEDDVPYWKLLEIGELPYVAMFDDEPLRDSKKITQGKEPKVVLHFWSTKEKMFEHIETERVREENQPRDPVVSKPDSLEGTGVNVIAGEKNKAIGQRFNLPQDRKVDLLHSHLNIERVLKYWSTIPAIHLKKGTLEGLLGVNVGGGVLVEIDKRLVESLCQKGSEAGDGPINQMAFVLDDKGRRERYVAILYRFTRLHWMNWMHPKALRLQLQKIQRRRNSLQRRKLSCGGNAQPPRITMRK